MILDAFTLAGKVAMVTGCDTGLGQGMAIALAQAGCDIVGVNRKVPDETAARVTALGRRFIAIPRRSWQAGEYSERGGYRSR